MANTADTPTNITTPGTMPKDMLSRYALKGNTKNGERHKAWHADATVRRMSRTTSTYRLLVHGSKSIRLPASLRYGVHYFAIPMSRADSDNPRDRRGLDKVESTEGKG